jgi:hypothetical protein
VACLFTLDLRPVVELLLVAKPRQAVKLRLAVGLRAVVEIRAVVAALREVVELQAVARTPNGMPPIVSDLFANSDMFYSTPANPQFQRPPLRRT